MSIAKSSIKMISKIYALLALKRVEITKSINSERLIRSKDSLAKLESLI